MAWLEGLVVCQKPLLNFFGRCDVYFLDTFQLDGTDTLFEQYSFWVFFKPAYEALIIRLLAYRGTDTLLYFLLIDLWGEKQKTGCFLFVYTKSSRAEND